MKDCVLASHTGTRCLTLYTGSNLYRS